VTLRQVRLGLAQRHGAISADASTVRDLQVRSDNAEPP
jgi:hypothetical protein